MCKWAEGFPRGFRAVMLVLRFVVSGYFEVPIQRYAIAKDG